VGLLALNPFDGEPNFGEIRFPNSPSHASHVVCLTISCFRPDEMEDRPMSQSHLVGGEPTRAGCLAAECRMQDAGCRMQDAGNAAAPLLTPYLHDPRPNCLVSGAAR